MVLATIETGLSDAKFHVAAFRVIAFEKEFRMIDRENTDQLAFEIEDFLRASEHLADKNSSELQLPSFVRLYIGGGINGVKFSFLSHSGGGIFPTMVHCGAGRFPAPQSEMNVAGWYRYDDPVNSRDLELKPYEFCFLGTNTNHTRPMWTVFAGFILAGRLNASVASLRFRDFRRDGAPTSSTASEPLVQLDEHYFQNGSLQFRRHIDHKISVNEMSEKTFAIVEGAV
jgi:hypothetical protein